MSITCLLRNRTRASELQTVHHGDAPFTGAPSYLGGQSTRIGGPADRSTTGVCTATRPRRGRSQDANAIAKIVGSREPDWAARLVEGTSPPTTRIPCPTRSRPAPVARGTNRTRDAGAATKRFGFPVSTGEQADNETGCCAGTEPSAVRVWALVSTAALRTAQATMRTDRI